MRALQISKYYPPIMGGIESVTWELAEGLNRSGVCCDVLCSNQRLFTQRDRAASGYEIVRAGSLGTLMSTSVAPTMAGQLRRMARRADLLHVHMPDPMAAAALWLTRPRLPLIVHWHSDVVRQRIALKAYEPLQRWLLQRADAIIATSEAYAEASDVLRAWRTKVAVIPIGISDNRGHGCSSKAAAIGQRFRRRKLVFALGRMTYYKGFEVLIDAAAALPDDCAVLIGGDGELLERYRTLVRRRGLSGKVHLPGHIADDDLPSYFEACDVFCMPSTVRAEAYGVAMLEAMVMGKPIVAADIAGSGVPWVNQPGVTGLNVPVGQPVALADALRSLLADDSMLARFGAAARRRYLDEFTAERMTARTIELYRRVMPVAQSRAAPTEVF